MNKILIVEDEERISNVEKAYLEKEGYEVYTSTTGLKALELFNSIEFSLVILDLMLPYIHRRKWNRINDSKGYFNSTYSFYCC
jgi:Response regulators consisting of a CheY-like receiver domain and a winged-helix DNA-binding domain